MSDAVPAPDHDPEDLLARCRQGDAQALDQLLRHLLPWLERRVHRRLGARLRARVETGDIVQDAVIRFLVDGPPVSVSDMGQLRALLARIVENTIRDRNDWFTAQRRRISRQRPLPRDTVLMLDPPVGAVQRPSQAAQEAEDVGWIRLGIELLCPTERTVIVMRDWQELSFREIGETLGISGEAARKRYTRTVKRLARIVALLRRGRLDQVLREHDGEEAA